MDPMAAFLLGVLVGIAVLIGLALALKDQF